MAAPTRRERLGVSPEMIEAFGPIIFDLSTNVQDRRGDPVRLLDFEGIERQRPGTGLSDPEIAARLGLGAEQVTYIRVLLEQRRFKPERYYRLFQLGGGKRFRADRGMERDAYYEPQFDADALAIRDALRFRAAHVQQEIATGRWSADTVATLLQRWARDTPDAIALAVPGYPAVSYAAALDRAERLAAALAALGVRRGDVVSVQLPGIPDFVIIYYAAARLGAVVTTLHMPYGAAEALPLLRHSRARAVFCGAATDKSDPPAMFASLAEQLPNLRLVITAGPPRSRHLFAGRFDRRRRLHDASPAAGRDRCGADVLHVGYVGRAQGGAAQFPVDACQSAAMPADVRSQARRPDCQRRSAHARFRSVRRQRGADDRD